MYVHVCTLCVSVYMCVDLDTCVLCVFLGHTLAIAKPPLNVPCCSLASLERHTDHRVTFGITTLVVRT